MHKTIIILYLICFSLYILFTRQPDYFDAEFTTAKIKFIRDSENKFTPKAVFFVANQPYSTDACYVFKKYKQGDAVKIIYESSQPQKAAVYNIWGYWLRWQELLSSIALVLILFQIAVAITNKPTPEGLISDIESTMPKKRKYQ